MIKPEAIFMAEQQVRHWHHVAFTGPTRNQPPASRSRTAGRAAIGDFLHRVNPRRYRRFRPVLPTSRPAR